MSALMFMAEKCRWVVCVIKLHQIG